MSKSTAELPEPPRVLRADLRRALWWGNPVMVFSMASTFLVVIATIFLFLLYEIPASALWSSDSEVVTVTSQISRKETKTLPGGDRITVVWAPVKVNETVIEARGYGGDAAEIGDPATIIIPQSDPLGARLEGFEAYPVRPHALLTMAGLFLIPGLLAGAWALVRARRVRELLVGGVERRGTRLRTIPLPRPLKDMALVRWQYEHGGGERRFWTLQKRALEKPPLVVAGKRAAILPNLLSNPVVEDGELGNQSTLARVCVGANTVLAILCLLSVLSFLLV